MEERGVKDDSKVFGLNKYKNEVTYILNHLTEMEKNVGTAGLGKSSEA